MGKKIDGIVQQKWIIERRENRKRLEGITQQELIRKALRVLKGKGYSRNDIARKVGVCATTLYRWQADGIWSRNASKASIVLLCRMAWSGVEEDDALMKG